MKKCVSCVKDLPDAALHCVFCGAKQPAGGPAAAAPTGGPAAPAPGGGGLQAKTVMGWQAADVLAGLQGKPTLVPGDLRAGPPPAAPPSALPFVKARRVGAQMRIIIGPTVIVGADVGADPAAAALREI